MISLTSSWLQLPALQALFEIFEGEGATLRLVGGAVRDGLLDLPVNDIDLAVDKDPHWVMDLLQKAHIKALPTGIEHGTVTAVLEKRPYQITTLRVDVKTFGRKANVAFTDDWEQDALRRDFTINAIYADKLGQLFDPVEGLKDLEAHSVRFIGNAPQRIQEDYLRILRFFRFSARFGHEPYDANGLAACQDFASHLPHLARERVTEEFLKILELPSPLYALEAMKDTGVLTYILYPGTWDDLKALVPLEKEVERTPSGLMRLAAFHPVLAEMKASLRLSKKQESTLSFLNKKHALVTEACFKHQAYLWSKEKTFDLALLQTARRIAASALPFDEGVAFFKCLCSQFEPWITPVFPVTGEDLLSRGVKQGKDLGVLLKAIETWWISQDFTPTRENCLAYLKTLVE